MLQSNEQVRALVLNLIEGNFDSINPLTDLLQELYNDGERYRIRQLHELMQHFAFMSKQISQVECYDYETETLIHASHPYRITSPLVKQRMEIDQCEGLWRNFVEDLETLFAFDIYSFDEIIKHVDQHIPQESRKEVTARYFAEQKFLKNL